MVEEKTIDIQHLFLDEKNYRIDFERYKTLQEVVDRLYRDEKIIPMMEGIVSFGGVYPHEKLIALPRLDGKYKIVEGNRRLLAIKSMLGLIEPPATYKKRVEALASQLKPEEKEALKHLGTVVYDIDEKAYRKILAQKHATSGYESWEPISQWHFFKDTYIENGKDIEATALELGSTKGRVGDFIRYHNLFSYIRSLSYWDDNGLRDDIESNNLEPTKFLRPLSYKVVQNALRISFRDYELVIPEDDVEQFNQILCRYTMASLFSTSKDDESIFTRTEPDEAIRMIDRWKEELNQAPKKYTSHNTSPETKSDGNLDTNIGEKVTKDEVKDNDKSASKSKNTTTSGHKKPVDYFEDLKCTLENQRLKRLTTELVELSKKNRMEKFPAAGVMLTRSLFESCLLHLVEDHGKMGEYHKSLVFEKEGKIYVAKEGLNNLLSFVQKNVKDLFDKKNVKHANKALEQVKSNHLDTFNSIVHDTWIDPSAFMIKGIAGDIRELLRAILNGNS